MVDDIQLASKTFPGSTTKKVLPTEKTSFEKVAPQGPYANALTYKALRAY